MRPFEFRWLFVIAAGIIGFLLGVLVVVVDVLDDYDHFLEYQAAYKRWAEQYDPRR